MRQNYIVATIKPWNIEVYKSTISKFPGKWRLISQPEKLTRDLIKKIKPRYVFFPHWSQLVPEEILNLTECVCFHETNLPFGRGGSPIQNLIALGHKKSFITAIRMVKELDAGPIYLKKPISLEGRAKDIFERNTKVVASMIKEIIEKEPLPKSQKGKVTIFKRRKPEQSNIANNNFDSLEDLYNHIRMLDAKTYPNSFLESNEFKFEFFNVKKDKGQLISEVKITKIKKEND